MYGCDGLLVFAQRGAHAVADGGLHEPLDHPEADGQENREGDEADEEGAGAEAHDYRPSMGPMAAFIVASPVAGSSMGIKKSATALRPGSITISLRKKPAALCQATMV